MIIDELMCQFSSGIYDERLMDIYVDDNKLNYQKQRYVSALRNYMEEFGSDDVEIYSAPGRSEVGGNHTDHQNGEILAASINLDAIGIVKKTTDAIPAKEEARRAGDPSTLIASSDKAKSILGWNPKYADLETIIDTAWRWHKGHPNGYQTV